MGITVGKCGKEGKGKEAHNYDFDIFVIGGGSGGFAIAREASKLGAKVALCDFVVPSGMGSRWGLGGTCVNVGCVPKKLMHNAALLGDAIADAATYGWNTSPGTPDINWRDLVASVQGHVRTLNWQYKVSLFQERVKYFHEFATFVDSHTLQCTNGEGESTNRTANHIIIAVGGRPRYLDIPGGKKSEYTITSDDIFSLKYNPGKVLVVGASYVALECASFLANFGCEVTVMVRSIILRGFDRQIVEKITTSMEQHGVNFVYGHTPSEIKKTQDGTPPVLQVTSMKNDSKKLVDSYNTVLVAVGRDPCTQDLHLERAGVNINPETKRIVANKFEQTSVKNIYAIGDVADTRPELTPPAIKAGLLLARRLYGNSKILMDYSRVPTTIYTTVEYSCVGLAEEEAVDKFGSSNVEVYHTSFDPLENALPQRPGECYVKLICLKSDKERILGFHYFGPHAGEVCQGFALSLRLGARKSDIDALTGIHPTCAEIFTTMTITKASGVEAIHTNC